MFVKGCEGDVGSFEVPHVDRVVEDEGGAGDLVFALWAPLNAPHRGDRLDRVQQPRVQLLHIPNLKHRTGSSKPIHKSLS